MVYDSTKKLSDSTCLSIGLPKKFLTPTYKTFQGKTKSELWKLATNHKVASALDWHSHEATIESFWIHPANRPSAKDIFISQSSIFRGYLKIQGGQVSFHMIISLSTVSLDNMRPLLFLRTHLWPEFGLGMKAKLLVSMLHTAPAELKGHASSQLQS